MPLRRHQPTSNRFLPVKRLVFSPFIDFSAAFRTEPPYALVSDTPKTGFVRPILELHDRCFLSNESSSIESHTAKMSVAIIEPLVFAGALGLISAPKKQEAPA